jgi:hypothetical protein
MWLMRLSTSLLTCAVVAAFPQVGQAHHSFVGFYDQSRIIEIEGVLRSTNWRNPHGTLIVDVTNDDGSVTQWRIETGSVSVLRIRGLDREFVRPGDRVRVAGEVALRRDNGLYARNMLLPSGEEVMLSIGIAPRWTDVQTGELLEEQYDEAVRAAAIESADGIFRVWSTVLDDPASFPLFKGGYPLTEAAFAAKAEWDSSDVVQLGCVAKGMPAIMISPYPVELHDDGDRIVMRFEEDNATRVVHLRPARSAGSAERSAMGYSVGRWADDGALVVTTNALRSGYLDNEGTPLSAQAVLTETFRMTDDEQRLDYTLHVNDPASFSEPFELQRYFIWRPELTVNDYDCVVAQ